MLKLKTTLLIALLLLGLVTNKAAASEGPGLITKVTGKGQPMVLIPGLTCPGAVWDETIAQLGDGYEFHTVTLPGFAGNSPLKDHEGKYLEKMRDLVLDYIHEQKLKKPIIMGHSLGGFLALTITIAEPDLPSKLVIVDSLPYLPAIQMRGMSKSDVDNMAKTMKTQMAGSANQSEETRKSFQRMMLKSMIMDSAKIERALQWGIESDTETTAQAMYELYTIDIREDIAKIKVPTLVLGAWIAYKNYGATRENTLQNYKDQYAKLDGAIVDLTDNGNHFIMWDDPEFLMNWVKKFL
ncbi:MAG: alpha/beta hydrolase [Roseivirga sp.]|nr:alpha/beta hydrolase [Roseivirga sp.]